MKPYKTSYGHEIRFGNVTDFIAWSKDGGAMDNPQNQAKLEKYSKRKNSFTNNYSAADILSMLENPPPCAGHVAKIKDSIECALNVADMPKRTIVRRLPAGDELNPFAWVRRDPDGWEEIRRAKVERSVVRIVCNVAVNAHRSPENLYYRGAAVCALADALEESGHSVEIDLVDGGKNLWHGASGRQNMLVTVKHAHSPLDLATVALVLGEIGYYRTMCLMGLVRFADKLGHESSEGLGCPAELPEELASGYDIILDSGILSLGDAIREVKKYAEKFEAREMD